MSGGQGSGSARLTRRLEGYLRLAHPFPTLLTAGATTALALLSGAEVSSAARLGLAMVLLQGSIGAVNDLIDVAEDARTKPGKPLVNGLVGLGAARRVAVGGMVMGIAAAGVGPATLALAGGGLACGLLYDLRGKGTPAAPLLMATGVALLPVFAATGAAEGAGAGSVDPVRAAVVVAGALPGGVALALAHAAADRPPPPLRLALLGVVSWALAQGTAVASFGLLGTGPWGWLLMALGIGVGLAGLARSWLMPAGAIAAGAPRRGWRWLRRRELGWELQAIGLALVAVGWWAGVGGLRGGEPTGS